MECAACGYKEETKAMTKLIIKAVKDDDYYPDNFTLYVCPCCQTVRAEEGN